MNEPVDSGAGETSLATLLSDVEGVLRRDAMHAWLVGGAVRDLLLGRVPHDVDLVVEGDAHTVAETLAAELGWAVAPLRAQTVRLVSLESVAREIDVSSVHGDALDHDLRLRDFTLNAIAVPLSAWAGLLRAGTPEHVPDDVPLRDPLGGVSDLRARRLVAASDMSFRADPGRVLRAATAMARLDVTPDARTERLAREAAPLLASLSPDRLREELTRLLDSDQAGRGLRWVAHVGANDVLVPGSRASQWDRAAATLDQETPLLLKRDAIPYDEGAWGTALDALRAWYAEPRAGVAARVAALRWSMLLAALTDDASRHTGVALPFAPKGRLGLIARTAARLVPRALELIRSGERRVATWRWFFADAHGDGEAGVHAIVCALAVEVAGGWAAVPDQSRAAAGWVLTTYFTDRERLAPALLLSGTDVVRQLGAAPGPELGDILRAVRAAQLDGALATQADALAFARTLLAR